jgi:hypothetical protein
MKTRSSRHVISPGTQQMMADTGAAISITAASYTWLTAANEVVQLLAGVVAIAAGTAAAVWHIERIKEARRNARDKAGRDNEGA